MLPKNALHEYWTNPDDRNSPERYLPSHRRNKRTQLLLDLFHSIDVQHNQAILELGCNVGRNLNALWNDGYRKLCGVEINPNAVAIMRQTFPDMKAKIRVGSIEDTLGTLGVFHVIFTIATLMHLHTDSEWIFPEMVKKTKRFIITMEDEAKHLKERNISRNYRQIFENLGMRCIVTKTPIPGLNNSYVARVFSK